MIEETTALNVSTEWLISMDYGSRFQSDIVRGLAIIVLQRGRMKDEEYMWRDCLGWLILHLSLFTITTFSFAILYIMTSLPFVRLISRLSRFNCCNILSTRNMFRCPFVTNRTALHQTISIHTYVWLCVMLVIDDPTVNCRSAVQAILFCIISFLKFIIG